MENIIPEPQEHKISYTCKDGKKRTYLPDFLIGDILYEVKPKRCCKLPNVILKFEAAYRYCAEKDLTFQIICEKDLGIKRHSSATSKKLIFSDPDVTMSKKRKGGSL